RDRAVPGKSRAQLGQGLHGGVRTYPFVVREHDRVTLASGGLDGDDLVVEESLFGRGGCPRVGARGKGVLLGASDTELAVVTLGGSTHRVTLEGIGETIVRGGVENLDRAVLVALAGLGSKCGALVIDSMPPATITSNSPAVMSWSARAIASRPDRQTLLIVTEGTSMGTPALTAAWREGIWPAPAWSTCPMTTYPTCSPPTPARSSAAPIAKPPRSTAENPAREPRSRPVGVLAPPTMTEPGMLTGLQMVGGASGLQRYPYGLRHSYGCQRYSEVHHE